MKNIGSLRKHRRIQEVLDGQRMCFADVARGLGITNPLVVDTACGKKNNRRVLRRFLELGVDPDVLDLPKDMLAEIEDKTAGA